jgi:hypothetical protein
VETKECMNCKHDFDLDAEGAQHITRVIVGKCIQEDNSEILERWTEHLWLCGHCEDHCVHDPESWLELDHWPWEIVESVPVVQISTTE